MKLRLKRILLFPVVLFICAIFGNVSNSYAADLYWSPGTEPMGDGIYWMDADNWNLKQQPQAGDNLHLPRNNWTAFQTFVNDSNDLNLGNIVIDGDYQWGPNIGGNPININGEILSTSNYIGYSTPTYFEQPINPHGAFRVRTYGTAAIQFSGQINAPNSIGLYPYGSGGIAISNRVTGSGVLYVNGVSGSRSQVALIDDANIQQKVVVRSNSVLLGGGTTGSLEVDSGGFVEPNMCISVKNLKMKGTYTPKINGSKSCTSNSRLNAKGSVDISGSTLTLNGVIDSSYIPKIGTKIILLSNDGSDKIKGYFKNKSQDSTLTLTNGYKFKIDYKGGSGNDVVITRVR